MKKYHIVLRLVVSFLIIMMIAGFIIYGRSFMPDLCRWYSESGMLIDYRNDFGDLHETMRQYDTALKAYYATHHAYPPSVPLREVTSDPERIRQIGGWNLDTLAPGQGADGLPGLTTPIAFLPGLTMDGYTNDPRRRLYYKSRLFTVSHDQGIAPLAYYNDNNQGWILISPGPDLDYDIVDPAKVYNASEAIPSEALQRLTYDPSNGIASSGDVYRYGP